MEAPEGGSGEKFLKTLLMAKKRNQKLNLANESKSAWCADNGCEVIKYVKLKHTSLMYSTQI